MILTLACATLLSLRAPQQALPEIAAANAKIRQVLIEYQLDFKAVLRSPGFRDPSRMDRYPGDTSPEMLGNSRFSPSAPVSTITGLGGGYTGSESASFAAQSKLEVPLQPMTYQMFYLLKGIAPKGGIVANTYTAVYCKGPMEGTLTFNSYATAILEGNVSGRLFSDSYFNAVITGDFSGSFENMSSCMVYVLGNFTGNAKLSKGAKVVIYGKMGTADLARIKGTGSVWLMNTDLPAGTQHVGDLTVISVPQNAPTTNPSFHQSKS